MSRTIKFAKAGGPEESAIIASREIHLKSRPIGLPTPDNFALVEVALTPPADGEVLVRNLWMSVDPYMRGRMNDAPSYIPPFELDRAMEGSAIGQIVASRAPQFKAGDYVSSMFGWRDAYVAKADQVQAINTAAAQLAHNSGVIGRSGGTKGVQPAVQGRKAARASDAADCR